MAKKKVVKKKVVKKKVSRGGQIINHLKVKTNAPVVGMGCTMHSYSDRHAGTVSRVSASGKTCWIKQDKVKRKDKRGMSEMQEYEYIQMPEAKEMRVSKDKEGQWHLVGGKKVTFGQRDAYFDFSY